MNILRIIGYAAAFVVILLAVSFAQPDLLASIGAAWPPALQRAVSVIVTWLIFWVAVWRPLGRRAERRQQNAQ